MDYSYRFAALSGKLDTLRGQVESLQEQVSSLNGKLGFISEVALVIANHVGAQRWLRQRLEKKDEPPQNGPR